MRLPDFLIIGAMKAGTSSMHRYLRQHPRVFPSERKELNFFTNHYDRGLEWYMQQFRSAVAGESSTSYLKAHQWPKTAERIHQHAPGARLICLLRNPIDRTLSHYLHSVWQGRESRPFSEIVGTRNYITTTSRYGWQLDHYLSYFRPEQIMLVSTEELNLRPLDAVRRVLRFIGVDDSVEIDTSRRHNVTAANLANASSRVPGDPGLIVDEDRTTISPEMRAVLADEFREDVQRLAASWPQFPAWRL